MNTNKHEFLAAEVMRPLRQIKKNETCCVKREGTDCGIPRRRGWLWRTTEARYQSITRTDGKKINGAHGVVHTAALETGSLLITTTRNAKRAQSKSGLFGILFLTQLGGESI